MEKDILIMLTGVIVGAMNAIAGGGMLVGFPVLVALGVPPLVANVTANAILPPGVAVAVGAYRAYVRRIPLRYAWLLAPIIFGAAAGALTLRETDSAQFTQLVPWLVLFGVVLFAFQPLIHLRLHHHIHHRRGGDRTLFYIGLAVLPASFYGGYFGAGYGFMMLAFLGFGAVHEIHMLTAMKNISSLVVSLVCLSMLAATGLVDWHVALVMGTGATAGGYLGAAIAQNVPSRPLRIFIILTGLCAAAYLALQT
ncbi:MAG: sulfite exporter TauE/SafE family protein [Candidatus Saccharimonadales bacterium]